MTKEYLLNRSHRQYTEIDEFKNYELITQLSHIKPNCFLV
jgi:hypothetical protein